MVKEDLAKTFKKYRSENHMKQSDLAEYLEIPQQRISLIEMRKVNSSLDMAETHLKKMGYKLIIVKDDVE